jgi:hypothetical protein
MSKISEFAARKDLADDRIEAAVAMLPPSRVRQPIYMINQATLSLGVNFSTLTVALQKYIDEAFSPLWGFTVRLIETTSTPPAGSWVLYFVDEDPTVGGALGYHSLSPGFPFGKVLISQIRKYSASVSVTAAHELVEILTDPSINLLAVAPNGVTYATENADAVEETHFLVNGLEMSNFVTPAYFDSFRMSGSGRFDYMRLVSKPFQLLPGGYSNILTDGNWGQIFGSFEAQQKFFTRHPQGGVFIPNKIAMD